MNKITLGIKLISSLLLLASGASPILGQQASGSAAATGQAASDKGSTNPPSAPAAASQGKGSVAGTRTLLRPSNKRPTDSFETAVKEPPSHRNLQAKEAIAHLQSPVEAGDPAAQYALGLRYLTGDGVEKNERLARGWLAKAARQGNDQAYEKLKNTDYFETQRDPGGRILRSATARTEFLKQSGYPQGRPGYVIVHLTSIEAGGSDSPENLKWETIQEARAKERWEATENVRSALTHTIQKPARVAGTLAETSPQHSPPHATPAAAQPEKP